jgi:glycosyltransferase involved in cell wall biosynthesis
MPPIAIHIVQHLRPGGIEVLVLNLLKHQSQPNQMLIVAMEDNEEEALKHWPLLTQYRDHLIFLNKMKGWDKHCFFALRHFLNDHSTLTLYTHHIGPLIYGRLANLGLKNKHIHIEHDAWHLENRRYCWLTKTMLWGNILLVADAKTVAKQLQLRLNHPVDHVINNGIDTQEFHPDCQQKARNKLNIKKKIHWIGCAGRLVKEKGIQDAITALSYLPTHWELIIAGDGPEKKRLQELSTQLQLTHRITWLGHHQDMPTFYQALDVFVMPSHQEGAPLALMEAQSCGCPVVASNVGAIHEYINQHNGRLVPPEHPRLIAKAIQSAPTPPKSQSTRFDIRHMVAQYQALR